ncbi:MAG: 4-alpha-glucanotransferase [Sorangium cellulosum]|nr:MAG: 4-alpha-glucanotransferase [Sorangium cellulosum]
MSNFVWPAVRVEASLARARTEWIVGNGAGAYASSTVALMHTRRYHGLLVAALAPPIKRAVIVSHFDTRLHVDQRVIELASHQFPGVPPSDGYKHLDRFNQDPLPRWTYSVVGAELEMTLALVRGHNALVMRYVWAGPNPISISVRPLLALRSHHNLTHAHGAMIQRVQMRAQEVSVQPVRDLPQVVFKHSGSFVGTPDWWHRFEYLAEQDRGLDFQEDLWSPGVFRITLQPSVPQYLVAGLGFLPERKADDLMQECVAAIRECDPGPTRTWAVRNLAVAANLFRCDLCPVPAIVAGYPWFEIWGRHTFTSIPGLYLVTGRVQQAKAVVQGLIEKMGQGLVPNRLPDDGQSPEYHAADATLMLFGVARRLTELLGNDDHFGRDTLLPVLHSVFDTLRNGTVEGIHVTEDGLLAAGRHGTSLTWMNARVDNAPVTSRAGLPIELQALWSKGCDDLAWLADRYGNIELAKQAADTRNKAREAFARRFWCVETNYPYDVISESTAVNGAWTDASIRPNALMALSTDPSLFTHEQAVAIVERVESELLTSAGIRTLSFRDPAYIGTYTGRIRDRDLAYHQGTVWPFLFGALSRATCHTFPQDEERRQRLRALLEGMLSNQTALGQMPEVADGDAPHRPDGCVAFAPSVAEMLRVCVEDLNM